MEYIFLVGNLIILIGAFPLIKEVVKHRKNLKGYSFMGALFTLIGVTIVQFGIIKSTSWVGVVPTIPIIIFWSLVCIYNWKKLKGHLNNLL